MTMPLAVTAALAAGSAALGEPLADPVPLGGSMRSAVLRCRDAAGGTVVVKTYPPGGEGPGSFATEAAGLALTGDAGLGPRLLAAGAESLTVVMSDLGSAPSLADLLLDGPAEAAGRALLDWARALGQLAAYAAGREAEHAELRARYLAGRPNKSDDARMGERILATAGLLASIGVAEPAGLGADLRAVAGLLESAAYHVFSPGDECPDNNLVTPAGLRFLDYEAAGFHPVFLDVAYIRMPFSTCWCVFQLPPGLAAEAEARFRAAVCVIYPGLADDAVWEGGVRRAMAAWTLRSTGGLWRGAQAGDEPLADDRPAPGRRQLLRHRWRVLAGELSPAGDLPALAELMTTLLAATEHWQAPELLLYPALRA